MSPTAYKIGFWSMCLISAFMMFLFWGLSQERANLLLDQKMVISTGDATGTPYRMVSKDEYISELLKVNKDLSTTNQKFGEVNSSLSAQTVKSNDAYQSNLNEYKKSNDKLAAANKILYEETVTLQNATQVQEEMLANAMHISTYGVLKTKACLNNQIETMNSYDSSINEKQDAINTGLDKYDSLKAKYIELIKKYQELVK